MELKIEKNEVWNVSRRSPKKSPEKWWKKTPWSDAQTSKTEQNAERGVVFRKMHISAQWTKKLEKDVQKWAKNDTQMR